MRLFGQEKMITFVNKTVFVLLNFKSDKQKSLFRSTKTSIDTKFQFQ